MVYIRILARRDVLRTTPVSQDPGLRITRRGQLAITATVATGLAAAATVPNFGIVVGTIDSKPQPGCKLLAPQYLQRYGQVVQQKTGLGMQNEQFTVLGFVGEATPDGGPVGSLAAEATIYDLNPNLDTIFPEQTKIILAAGSMCTRAANLGYTVGQLPGQ